MTVKMFRKSAVNTYGYVFTLHRDGGASLRLAFQFRLLRLAIALRFHIFHIPVSCECNP